MKAIIQVRTGKTKTLARIWKTASRRRFRVRNESKRETNVGQNSCRKALLILALLTTASQAELRVQAKTGVPSKNEFIGPFRLEYRMPLNKHRRIVSRMQRFAWSHWNNQRPGTLFYRFVTAEGASVDFTLLFEKDEQGVWRVRIERKERRTKSVDPSHPSVPGSTKFAYSVQRVDGKRPVGDDYLPFPPSEDPVPGKYILDFRDKEGQVIMRWEPENNH
jgi:hypothetical protein